MGWQWQQLDHMQIICTSLQTVLHHSIFYRPDALPDTKPTEYSDNDAKTPRGQFAWSIDGGTDQTMSWSSEDLVTLGGAPCSMMRMPSRTSGSACSADLLVDNTSHR